MIDLILLAIVGVVTWTVSEEGTWNAVILFVGVIISGLLAMNFFEPFAIILQNFVPAVKVHADFIMLVGLFAGLITGYRFLSEYFAPTYIMVPGWLDTPARWLFGAATGYVTMAIMLTALHTAHLPREFLGFTPERKNFLEMAAPDRQWLGFTQYVTEYPYASYIRTNDGQFVPYAFDGRYLALPDDRTPAAQRYKNSIWPSFPMRYAMRRAYASMGVSAGGGSSAAPRPAVQPGGPRPVAPPSGGAGGF